MHTGENLVAGTNERNKEFSTYKDIPIPGAWWYWQQSSNFLKNICSLLKTSNTYIFGTNIITARSEVKFNNTGPSHSQFLGLAPLVTRDVMYRPIVCWVIGVLDVCIGYHLLGIPVGLLRGLGGWLRATHGSDRSVNLIKGGVQARLKSSCWWPWLTAGLSRTLFTIV